MSASGRGALTRKTNIGVPIVGSSKVAESHFGGRWVSSFYGRGYPFEGILLIQPYLVSAAMGDGSLKGLVDKSADLLYTAQKISVPSRPYVWLRLVSFGFSSACCGFVVSVLDGIGLYRSDLVADPVG